MERQNRKPSKRSEAMNNSIGKSRSNVDISSDEDFVPINMTKSKSKLKSRRSLNENDFQTPEKKKGKFRIKHTQSMNANLEGSSPHE